ncbi:hypothetical protein ACE6H2_017327 [Prunus campanulata]
MQYYWYLTNDGIEFLRNYLNLPSEIVPATLKKQAKPPGRPLGPSGDRPRSPPRFDGGERRFGDRDGYRSVACHSFCPGISKRNSVGLMYSSVELPKKYCDLDMKRVFTRIRTG